MLEKHSRNKTNWVVDNVATQEADGLQAIRCLQSELRLTLIQSTSMSKVLLSLSSSVPASTCLLPCGVLKGRLLPRQSQNSHFHYLPYHCPSDIGQSMQRTHVRHLWQQMHVQEEL